MKKLLTKKYWGTKNHRYGVADKIKIFNTNIPACLFFTAIYAIGYVIFIKPFITLENISITLSIIIYTITLLLVLILFLTRFYNVCNSLSWSKDWHKIDKLIEELDKKYPNQNYRDRYTIRYDGEWYCAELNPKKE